MTAPVPEETNAALDLTEAPPGEHASELTGADGDDAAQDEERADDLPGRPGGQAGGQAENAETSLDQPST